MNKRWILAEPDPATEMLAREVPLSKPLAQVLANRGYRGVGAAQRFLNPQLRQLSDPFALPDMDQAVERVLTAIEKAQRIVIYGDYDVDGVTSSALLLNVLLAAGARVDNFLPHRMDEGYGLSKDGLARCLQEHNPELLIAVDCGTSSCVEIADLNQRGVHAIVLDHHEPPSQLPDCVALVNPKKHANGEPLASVGVTFKLAHALLKHDRRLAEKIDLRDHLDLVAIGTVADLVPLTGENRILVKAGLDRLPHTRKVGLQSLMEVANVPERVKPFHIGFRIGPRLNAAGRLADAMAALELLLTNDGRRAMQLAEVLDRHNAERQQIEQQITEEAQVFARKYETDRVLVLANPEWHIGVIGIVASRVTQQFYRPTVIIGKDGKGSCRSVAGFSIVEALAKCAPVLERFGGHEMAAGLSVDAKNIDELRRLLNEHAAQVLKDEDLQPRIRIDAVVQLDELDAKFFDQLEHLEPCGQDNPEPTLAVFGVRLRGQSRVVGKDHLKFLVTDGATSADAIWWKMAERELPHGSMDVAFNAELNEYRGERSLQLRVRDVRAAA